MSRLLLVLWGGHPRLRMPSVHRQRGRTAGTDTDPWQRLRAPISAAKGLPPAEANRQAEGHTILARPRSGARSLGPGHGAVAGSARQPTPSSTARVGAESAL